MLAGLPAREEPLSGAGSMAARAGLAVPEELTEERSQRLGHEHEVLAEAHVDLAVDGHDVDQP